MPEKNQTFIYNSTELALIKQTFAENDELLYAIRKVFLQFPLTESEKSLVRGGVTEAVYNVLRKRILPDLSPDFPLSQLPSILTTLTNDLKVKDEREMALQFAAKKIEIDYLAQQFAVLKDIEASTPEPIKLANMAHIRDADDEFPKATIEANFVNMTAYLFILGYIDPMLGFIKSIAGKKEETEDEQKKRLSRDSSE